MSRVWIIEPEGISKAWKQKVTMNSPMTKMVAVEAMNSIVVSLGGSGFFGVSVLFFFDLAKRSHSGHHGAEERRVMEDYWTKRNVRFQRMLPGQDESRPAKESILPLAASAAWEEAPAWPTEK